ncbi:MAG: putative manganese transporter [Bilifractor sp.]|jgi:hypothetical protein
MLTDVLADAVLDTLKLLPFLFLTYLLMEYLESRTEEKTANALRKVGRWGPVFGGAVGIIPQCGFSAAAASLFSGGVITVGTLLSVFLSTSDEMLPILISERAGAWPILKIILVKMTIGIITGVVVDFLNRRFRKNHRNPHEIHELCEREHCGCDEEGNGSGIVLPALRHTFHIAFYIFLISVILDLILAAGGENTIKSILSGESTIGVLLSALIGLIPNCGASVILTELFLKRILGSGQMIAGLLVNAGLGLLVLYRTNRHPKENLQITAVLYVCGVLWGLLIDLTGISFI